MNRKLTVGIDVDPQVRKMLGKQVAQWEGLPLRLHAPESYHVPIISFGWVDEDLVPDIVMALSDVASHTETMTAALREIAPHWKKRSEDGEIGSANALWCHGENSDALKSLYAELLEALEIPHGEVQHFAPHIVLGQMKKKQWEVLEQFPTMQVDFPLTLDVMHITLFEESSEDGARTFVPLEVFELQ